MALGDPEPRVVVAALLARVLDHLLAAGGQADAPYVLVQLVFEAANARLEVSLSWQAFWRGMEDAEEVVKADQAAPDKEEDARLEALGAVVLQVFFHCPHVGLEIMHVGHGAAIIPSNLANTA